MTDPQPGQQEVLPSGYQVEEVAAERGPAHGRRPPRRGTRNRWGKRLAAALAVLVVLVALVLVWANSQINPGKAGRTVSVDIPAGSSTSRIGSILAHAGVIHDAFLFSVYVKVTGDGPLLPGKYNLPKSSSYSSAIKALEAGPKILVDKLVIPEGFTVRQAADAVASLPGLGLSSQKFLQAATDGTVRSPYEPPGVNNLEGLLFPATYDIRQGQTETDILEQMIGAFDDHAASLGLNQAAATAGLTPYQVVTDASIVEREAKHDSDRGNVASVIYNRLRVGMPLGADSTQTYYLRITQPGSNPTPSQLDAGSPYNTRLNKGLPPTPIASPGLPSLQAAVSPPSTSYLYFVEVNPDGQLGFASTSAGFSQLQQQCRAAKLC
ncbi:MAG TPA: endolytic transglycosylase MltG [Acidimicrobiales bacterium]|nr:endolytic transglycosylase MltG [Acidimicrobiales bacterium]